MGAKFKILLGMLLAGLLPVLALVIITCVTTRRSIIDTQREEAEQIARPVGAAIAGALQKVLDEVHACQHNPLLLNPSAAEGSRLIELRRLLDTSESIEELTLHGSDSILSTNPAAPYRAPAEAFAAASEGQLYIDLRDQRPGSEREEPMLSIFAPLQAKDGDPGPADQILEIKTPLKLFWGPVASAQLAQPGPVVLLDARDRVLAHRNYRQIREEMRLPLPGDGETPLVEIDGEQHFLVQHPVRVADASFPEEWRLAILLPQSAVNAVIASSLKYQIGAGVVAVVLACGIGIGLTNRIARLKAEATATGASTSQAPAEDRSQLQELVARREGQLDQSRSMHGQLRAQLKAVLEHSEDPMVLLGADDLSLIEANTALFDFCELTGEHDPSVAPGALPKILAKHLANPGAFLKWWDARKADSKQPESQEWSLKKGVGKVTAHFRPVLDAKGEVSAILLGLESKRPTASEPSTENKPEIEASPNVKSRRFEQVNNLMAGIACDFNHSLTNVIGNLALADSAEDPAEREDSLLQAKHSAHRGAELVRQLLAYSQSHLLQIKPTPAAELLESARQLLEAQASSFVSFKFETADEKLSIRGDRDRLLDVLLILGRNAMEAMPGGGTLTVRAEALQANPGEPTPHPDALDYISLVVEDTGHGIPTEIRDRIFEPFFSSREDADGLGLSTASGIVWQHGGWISCETTVDGGTTFRVCLPAVETAKPPKRRRKKPGSDSILVVDDEDIVRRLNEAILKRGGYETIGASNAEEALQLYFKYEKEISLIVLDLNMPGVDGKEFFQRLRSEFKYVPVVVVSGFLLDFDAFEMDGGARPEAFIQKPYQADQFLTAVNSALGAAAA